MSKKTKKHYNKAFFKIAFIIVLILIIFIIVKKTNTKVENIKYEKTQIILNNENITTNLKKDIIIQENKRVYMSLEDIKEYLDTSIYIEEETIITTCNKKIATMSEENTEYIIINGSKQSIKNPVIKSNEQIYLQISALESVYNYKFSYIEATNIVTIDNLNKQLIKAYANKDLMIKEDNKFSKTIEKVKKGTWIIFIKEENANTAKIRTQLGNIGYVNKKLLDNFVTEREDYNESNTQSADSVDYEYDLTNKDITTFKKREEIINSILQEMIKNDKINVKIIYNEENNMNFERFKIESTPILTECGISINF